MHGLLSLIGALPPAIIGGSLWDILAQASGFSLLILAVLLILSVVSWAVIFLKWRSFKRITADSAKFRLLFRKGRRLSDRMTALAALQHMPHWRVIDAGYAEVVAFTEQNRGTRTAADAGFDLTSEQKKAVSDTLDRVSQEEIGKLEEWTIFLATTANASPFLGLLGTCWGIMNSFMGIGATGSASLVVVAPGIAEALIATVVGLAAAIPAVIAYNWCVRRLRVFGDDLSNLSLEFLTELTRENVRETSELSRSL